MNELPPEIQRYAEYLTIHGGIWIYFGAMFAMFFEYVFPPFPGDVAIFAAGFISGQRGALLPVVLIAAFAGSMLGVAIVYWAGKKYGRRIIESEKIWFLNRKLILRTELWYKKVGEKLLIFSKFLPGVRFALVFFAGIANVPFRRAMIFTAISCAVWNSMVIMLAYYMRRNLDYIYEIFSTYRYVVMVVLIVIILSWIGRTLWTRRLERRIEP